jgi:hypothetical protein
MLIRSAVLDDALLFERLIRDYLDGGTFLRGGAYNRPSTRTFYDRVAVVDATSGAIYINGSAEEIIGQP